MGPTRLSVGPPPTGEHSPRLCEEQTVVLTAHNLGKQKIQNKLTNPCTGSPGQNQNRSHLDHPAAEPLYPVDDVASTEKQTNTPKSRDQRWNVSVQTERHENKNSFNSHL